MFVSLKLECKSGVRTRDLRLSKQQRSRPYRFSYRSKDETKEGVGLLLGQRLRRWPNNKQTPAQCLVFAGIIWAHR